MDYPAALDYILSFADYERAPRSSLVFDLRRVEMLLARLGNPQEKAKSIHIAGTKGKGSTAAMIASILTQAGYKTGLYTSPHLLSFTERFQVDGKPISESAFGELVEVIKPEAEAVNNSSNLGELTTFELLTALAFTYFEARRVDYQVLETGLGGRLDATNMIKPEVCVITSVSFDHTDVLGNTLTQIATEKAGIIKPGSVVVCSPQFPEATKVIERICHELGARLVRVDNEVTWHRKAFSSEGQSFQLTGISGKYNLYIPLLGEHQLENAATAVATAEVLAELGTSVSPESITTGLKQVDWPGRLQILQQEPWVVADSAHNAYSAKRLAEALEQYFSYDQMVLIFGVSSDKNVAGMIDELAPLSGTVIITRSRHPRAVDPAKIAAEFSRRGITPIVTKDVASAMELTLDRAMPGDLICATGSLFIVAEVMEYMSD